MSAADRLRTLLAAAAENAYIAVGQPDDDQVLLDAIVDAQMAVFADVTVQSRKRVDDDTGRMGTEHRIVALTPFEPAKETPDA